MSQICKHEVLIGAYKGVSLISRMIRRWTWREYSHVAGIRNATGEVVEAWHKGGVRHLPTFNEGHTPGTRIDVFRVKGATLEQHEAWWKGMLAEVGKKYDFAGIVGFIRRKVTQNQDRWFCSELVFDKAIRALIPLLLRIKPHKVDPGTLVISPKLEYVGFVVVGRDRMEAGEGVAQIADRNRG